MFSLLRLAMLLLPLSGDSLSCNTLDCDFQCDGTPDCKNTTIYCQNNVNGICSITCKTTDSCFNSIIMAKSVATLELHCNVPFACTSITVYGPVNVTNSSFGLYSFSSQSAKDSLMFLNDTKNIFIQCTASSSCEAMTIYALNSNSLEGYFSRINAFKDSQMYASNMNNMSIHCLAESSCNNMAIYAQNIVSMYLECDNDACPLINVDISSAQYATIDCDTCVKANIYGYHSEQIDLVCNQFASCNHTNIYCPNSINSLCSISCSTAQSCHNLAIYNVDGYENGNSSIELECNNNACNGAKVLCTQYYNYSCDIMQFDSLECVSDDNICGITLSPTTSPTEPTVEPTFMPTIPTIDPTTTPTESPIIPTKSPTTPSPTKVPKVAESNQDDNDDKGNSLNISDTAVYLILLGVIVCCCGLCFIAFFGGIHHKLSRK